MQIILASESPYRKTLLENFGLKILPKKPNVDEEKLKQSGPKDTVELTRHLALEKARSLAPEFPSALILGGDQIVEFDGRHLGKPGNKEKAIEQLKSMSGKSHRVITSVCGVFGTHAETYSDVTTVKLKPFNSALVEKYIALDTPFDCAGAYKMEKAGLSLVERIETKDPSAIQGFPLLGLMHVLSEFNISIHDLWAVT